MSKLTGKDVQYNVIENTVAVVIIGGKSHMVSAGDPRFKSVTEALFEGEFDKLPKLLDLGNKVATYMHGNVEVKNGGVFYKGNQLEGLVIDRMLAAMGTSKDYSDRLVKFIDKLYQNPSRRSVEQLYRFLEHKGLALAEDGDVFGYKGVNDNYTSVSCGREPVDVSTDGSKTWETMKGHIPNNVGNVIRMSRNLVADDPDVACSYGLHVGSLSYATGFGSRTVIVKFNPANAVSVPNDCDCQKLRTCEYTVVGDYEGELPQFGADSSNPYGEADVPDYEDDDFIYDEEEVYDEDDDYEI